MINPHHSHFQILLVEDDPAHAELISRSFETVEPFHLTTVNNLDNARKVLASTAPDLIITDIQLPDGNGVELLKNTQKEGFCPVIVMTSYGDESVAVDAMKAGASDYIVKTDKALSQLPTIAHRILREWRLILEKKIVLEQQNRLTAILEATPDLICMANVDGFLSYLNDAGYKMLGFAENAAIDSIRLIDFYSPADKQLFLYKAMPYAIEHGIWKGEITIVSKENVQILSSLVLITHKSATGGIEFFSIVARDIRNIRMAEQKIEYLAYYDTLTDLPNRNELLRQLDHEIGRVNRQHVQSALLFIDLDNFKFINDSLGHSIGDWVLKEIAYRLKSTIRSEDTLARLGGDEFVVILSNLSKKSIEALNQARDVSKKLNEQMAKDMLFEQKTFNLTASIGIAMFSSATHDSHELLRFADAAMYEAKKSGKNQFEVFHKGMGELVHQQLELEHKLRRSCINHEYELFYQCKVDAKTNTICGAEALLRWNDPQSGLKSPAVFLDVLESSGLIAEVGEWVLAQSFTQLADWIASGVWNPRHRLSINISARQFHNARFAKVINLLLKKIDVPAQCIDIEITEYSVINDVEKAVLIMQELIDQGISFSLDDFGTGYSSLSYLKLLPVATLKIDRSFIMDITESESDKALVSAILAISKSLGLSVVAEGIENEAQKQLLKSYDCDCFQGYFFSKPIPAAEFETLLRQ